MDERAQLDGMHFGIEIETVNLCRKDTVVRFGMSSGEL